jgi:hypothetical protein
MDELRRQVAEGVNAWVGGDHTFTPEEIRLLAWALAMDDEARSALARLVYLTGEAHAQEMRAANPA